MKKIILAPAVALAFTGLVASPVAAAESPSTQSASTKADAQKQDKADQAKKDEAEKQKKAEEEAAAKKAEAEKKAKQEAKKKATKKTEEKEAADKAAKDKAAQTKDEKSKTPKKVDNQPASDSKDDSKDADDDGKSEDKADPINASLTVDPTEITAEDLADKDEGVTATVTGVEKGDTIKDSLTGKTETADADGDYKLHLWYEGNPKNLDKETVPLKVTINREDTESTTLNGTIDIVDEASEGTLTLTKTKVEQSEFVEDGVEIKGSGFEPNAELSLSAGNPASVFYADEVTADENGEFTTTVTTTNKDLEPGDYTVRVVPRGGGEPIDEVTLTVIEDEDAVDPIDASLKVDPKKITAEDLADKDKGVTATVTGVEKGDTIKDSLTGKTETADADGDYTLHLWYEGNPKNLEVGKVPFTVTINREGTESKTLNGAINVIDDESEAPAEASFKVSPKKIEAADFANEKKGVTLTVKDCEPGADIHFKVTPKGINVTAYENTVKTDDEGRASVNVFGTSSNASAYVGSYTATATCGDDTMKDSFTVIAGAKGGGDNGNGGDEGNGNAGNGNGDDGSQLPRTGADLGGLTTGALLLLVGGTAIALTGRKNKFGQSPTSF